MNLDFGPRRAWTYLDVALYLVGIVGLSASLTILWLGMRAVLGVGGFCAEGGPYVIAQHCPGGTALLIPLAIFAGLGSAGLMAWEGTKLGSPWAALVGLAWPALFISLGFNFLQFAMFPPEGMDGIQLGWLIPGLLFVIMGAVPLIGFLPGGKSWKSDGSTSTFAFMEPDTQTGEGKTDQHSQLLNDLVAHARDEVAATQATEPAPAPLPVGPVASADASSVAEADPDLVSRLERLDALHRSGALTYDEFHRAKAALLTEAAKS